MQTFKNADTRINTRNQQIQADMEEMSRRYKMGVENIRLADGDLNIQKKKINQHILKNFKGM